jgi:hypothetical protein
MFIIFITFLHCDHSSTDRDFGGYAPDVNLTAQPGPERSLTETNSYNKPFNLPACRSSLPDSPWPQRNRGKGRAATHVAT